MSKIENLNFYIVEDGYIEYASRWDHHIAYNKNNKRPYVGIVFKINGFSYFSPMFSPKKQHEGYKENLNLTYAVRDGIISHCGEIDENSIKPREEAINLENYTKPNEYAPFTWEGCVVKISDKISYLGRDIEDALRFKILTEADIQELQHRLDVANTGYDILNTTNIVSYLMSDLLKNTTLEKGLTFSHDAS